MLRAGGGAPVIRFSGSRVDPRGSRASNRRTFSNPDGQPGVGESLRQGDASFLMLPPSLTLPNLGLAWLRKPDHLCCARTAYLNDSVVAALRNSLGRRQCGAVFLGRGDAPMTARHAERRFAQCLECASITGRWTPHSLRHTFATELYQRTDDIALVKEALGHRSIMSTLVYARAGEDQVREAVLAGRR